MTSLPMVLAGLMGASGVLLAALAAHAQPGSGLDSAAHMLLFHALAVVGSSALSESGRLRRNFAHVAIAGWLLGGTLFAGDIAMRAFLGHRLFPMAAPVGGGLLIASWLVFALAAAFRQR
jgi:uncharacterized membrane protein YgdD (TMEM256/DUF423 family)